MPARENEAVRARAARLYAAGHAVERIARVLGCCPSSVCNWARAAGEPHRGRRPRLAAGRHDAHIRAAVAAGYAAGVSLKDLSQRFGFCIRRVSDIGRAAGHPPRPAAPPLPAETAAVVVDLYAQGARVVDIRRRTGVGFGRMLALVRAAGVPLRRPGRPEKGARPRVAEGDRPIIERIAA